MGFCTGIDVETFFDTVVDYEALLIRSGLEIRKYYLDITRNEQKKRLEERKEDPLKTWKNSPVDAKAQKKWDDYTKARDDMFRRTNHTLGPWRVVRANQKKRARLGVICDLLDSFDYKGKDEGLVKPDRDGRLSLVAGSGEEGSTRALKEVLRCIPICLDSSAAA
jgi:polyphosphate kinase 2 (PPK2 family)